MSLDNTKVLIGTADQSTTGAIMSGAVIATAPATFSAAQTAIAGFTSSGYVSQDGLSLSADVSTNDIKEWNGATVRKVLTGFDGTLSCNLIQADYDGWCQVLGAENVTKTAATTTAGEQLVIKMGAHLPGNKAWAFKMKDGDAKMIIIVPNGQVTSSIDMTFSASEAISLPVEVSCYDDGTGNNIYIYTDDGQTTSSGTSN